MLILLIEFIEFVAPQQCIQLKRADDGGSCQAEAPDRRGAYAEERHRPILLGENRGGDNPDHRHNAQHIFAATPTHGNRAHHHRLARLRDGIFPGGITHQLTIEKDARRQPVLRPVAMRLLLIECRGRSSDFIRGRSARSPSRLSRGSSRFTKRPIGAIFDRKGVKTMTEMRTLFESLLVLGVIVASGTMLAVIFR